MFFIPGLEPEIKTLVLSPFFRLKFFYVLRMTFPVFGISPLNMDKLKVMFFSWLLQWVRGKEFAFNAEDTRDTCSVPELGRSPGEGNDNPLQYSCLENPMDRGVWQAIVHGVARVRHDLATKPPHYGMKGSSAWLKIRENDCVQMMCAMEQQCIGKSVLK